MSSRKTLIFIIINISIIFSITTQAIEEIPDIMYGLKLGMVSSDQDWDFTEELDFQNETRDGIEFGVFMEWQHRPFFSVVYGIHIIEKGMLDYMDVTDVGEIIPGDKENNNLIRYVSFPILFKFKYSMKGFNPYLFLGPRIDLFISSTSENFQGIYNIFPETVVGLDLGGGVELDFTKKFCFLIEYRYSMDLEDSYDKESLSIRNESNQITVGIKYKGFLDELLM